MPRHVRTVLLVAVAILSPFVTHHVVRAAGPAGASVHADGTIEVDGDARAATFRFAPSVPPADQAWILAAVASARPEARRLIDEVDGLTTIHAEVRDAALPGGTRMGEASSGPGGYGIWLNLARLDTDRAIDRATTVLHELGHVIDFALLSPGLDRRLDAGIPRGGPCEQDTQGAETFSRGSCAASEERIADTFAKWALGGAVSLVGTGYGIPSPPSLEDWGRPLAALAAGLPA